MSSENLEKIGKISRVDLFLWVGNFFSVIFCGIIIGFIIGFCLLLITLAYSSLLGTSEISKTDSGTGKGFANRSDMPVPQLIGSLDRNLS